MDNPFAHLIPQKPGAAPPDPDNPFAHLIPTQEERVNASSDALIPRPEPPPHAQAPRPRLGDSLKPVFGGHNPVAETADLLLPEISKEEQAFRDGRGLGERALDTAAFAASMPVRMVTGGKVGLGDAVGYIAPSVGDSLSEAEADFARANAPALNVLGAIGEVSMMLPPGAGPALKPTVPPRAPASPPVPYTNRVAVAADTAERDLAAFERHDVRAFGPAFSQGPVASAAKQMSEMPLVGAPVRNALEESLTGVRDRVQAVAADLADTHAGASRPTYETAGSRIQHGLERFRNAGVDEIEPATLRAVGIEPTHQVPARGTISQGAQRVGREADRIRSQSPPVTVQTATGTQVAPLRPQTGEITARRGAADLTDAELEAFVRLPTEQTSFAARAEAMYERAIRMVPEFMRQNGGPVDSPVAAVNMRNAILELDDSIARDITGRRLPLSGDLANALRDPNTTFVLDDLRAMRTEIGRALSHTDPNQGSLYRSDLKALYGAFSRDIDFGIQTLADRARVAAARGQRGVTVADANRAEGALRAYKTADDFFRIGIHNADRVSRVMGAENPTQAASMMVRAALDGDKGNAQMFRTAMAALRPDERNGFASLILREMGAPLPSARGLVQEIDFSVSSFMTRWNALSPGAKAMLFGGEHRAALNEIAQIAERLANVEALANTSRSATNAIGLGSMLTHGGAYAAGGGAGLLSTLLVPATFSVIMSRPVYAKWAVKYARMRQVAMRSPNGVLPALKQHVRELQNLALFDPQLAAVVAGFADEAGNDE